MTTLVCLHGWGGSQESFTELRAALKIPITPCLPPTYPVLVKQLSRPSRGQLLITPIGWSNLLILMLPDPTPWWPTRTVDGLPLNCWLAILLNILRNTFFCALLPASGGDGIFKRIIGLLLAKIGKGILSLPGLKTMQPLGKKILYKLVRVHDYERASPVMQQTLILVSKADQRPHLGKIDVPVDIFWGTADGMTPYADAKIMVQAIPQATLHTYPGVRHGVHREKADAIAAVIKQRLS